MYLQDVVECLYDLVAHWEDVLLERTAKVRDDADGRKAHLRIFVVVKSGEKERLELLHVLGKAGSHG